MRSITLMLRMKNELFLGIIYHVKTINITYLLHEYFQVHFQIFHRFSIIYVPHAFIYSGYFIEKINVTFIVRWGLTCCVFKDALLHSTVIMRGYLTYNAVGLKQSDHSPLTSLINKVFSLRELPLTGYLLFFAPFSVNCACMKIPGDQQRKLIRVLKLPHLASIIIARPRSIRSHFFPILMFGLNNSYTSWLCMHYALSCCHMIGWLDICINGLEYRST